MEDPNKNSLDYKVPKLKDLLKGSGFEEIPKKVFDSELTVTIVLPVINLLRISIPF